MSLPQQVIMLVLTSEIRMAVQQHPLYLKTWEKPPIFSAQAPFATMGLIWHHL